MAKHQREDTLKEKKPLRDNVLPKKNAIKRKDTGESNEQRLVKLQLMLLAAICLDNNVYFSIRSTLNIEKIASDEVRQTFQFAVEKIEGKAGIVAGEILNKLSPPMAESFANIIQSQSIFENNNKAAADIIKKIDLYGLEARKEEIIKMKKSSDLTEGDVELLNRELSSIVLNIAALKKAL
jgi:DNA primase